MAVSKTNKLRILIAHPRLGWGGSEKRVLWGIQALKDRHEVTLVTAGNYDLVALNKYYGTDLKKKDFTSLQVPLPPLMSGSARMAALRGAFFQRFCRKISKDYDVLISGYGPTDFGQPAIHFIADFSWDDELREELHPYPPGIVYGKNFVRRLYIGLAKFILNPSGRDLFSGDDLMLSVSPWVSNTIKARYGVDSPVLNSPVPGDFADISTENKEYGFVCLGRISPEKRIEDIIEIFIRVRAKGRPVHLHIIGDGDSGAYMKKITDLCKEHQEWIKLEGRKVGKEKNQMLATHAFGLHACHGDAFPGAVIEMMKAGCVVWAHDSGGQRDILQSNNLLYKDIEDAVIKIDNLLSDERHLDREREKLMSLASQYTPEYYQEKIMEIVEEWGYGS